VSTGSRTPATGRSATLMNSSTDEAFVTRKPADDHFAPHRNEHWLTCPCRKLNSDVLTCSPPGIGKLCMLPAVWTSYGCCHARQQPQFETYWTEYLRYQRPDKSGRQYGNIGSAPLRIMLRWLLPPSVWSRLCLGCSTAERQGAHGEIMPIYGLNIVCSRASTGDSR
jgi:hypothetical protein